MRSLDFSKKTHSNKKKEPESHAFCSLSSRNLVFYEGHKPYKKLQPMRGCLCGPFFLCSSVKQSREALICRTPIKWKPWLDIPAAKPFLALESKRSK